jgi:hypothetical protein
MVKISLLPLALLSTSLEAAEVLMQRVLPPVIAIEATSFNVTATAQEAGGREVAKSMAELLKAKVQNDERFLYQEKSPALNLKIVLTRFLVEPKNITDGKRACTIQQGSIQGTFQVLETANGRPVASDSLSWKLAANTDSYFLEAPDGRAMALKGASHRFSTAEMRENAGQEVSTKVKGGITDRLGLGGDDPCKIPLTPREAADVLADIFITEIVHLATPYKEPLRVKGVPGDKLYRPAVEDLNAGNWQKALDTVDVIPPQKKDGDEAERLFMLGLAYEGLGYQKGEQVFAVLEKMKPGMKAIELRPLRTELEGIEKAAREYFDKAVATYKQADFRKANKDYREGGRRSEESRLLYVRIAANRLPIADDPAPPPPAQPASTATKKGSSTKTKGSSKSGAAKTK